MNIFKLFEYYKRAHSVYFGFIIQIFNFLNLLFLLGISFGFLEGSLISYCLLVGTFICFVFPIFVVIGRFDYTRGSFIQSHKIIKEKSPIYQELFRLLEEIHDEVCRSE